MCIPKIVNGLGHMGAWAFFLGAVWLFPACKKNSLSPGQVEDSTYFDRLSFIVQANYSFSMYNAALVQTGYADTLSGKGPYTILVPDNDAMTTSGYVNTNTNIPDNTNYFLKVVSPSLSQYLQYFILPGKISFDSLPIGNNQPFQTLLGTSVYVTKYVTGSDTVITVNGSKLTTWDQPASNGLLDVLSSVPEPDIYPNLWQRMQADNTLAYFVTAVQRAGLVSLFKDSAITVLAPQNGAFTTYRSGVNGGVVSLNSQDSILADDPAVLKDLLEYHILKGRVYINDLKRQAIAQGDNLVLTMYDGKTLPAQYTPPSQYYGSSFDFQSALQTQAYQGTFDYSTYTYVYGYSGPGYPQYAYFFSAGQTYPFIPYQDRTTGNGVLQVIDNILMPKE